MEIIGYGEDALTLWAIKNKLHAILQELNDNSDVSRCKYSFAPALDGVEARRVHSLGNLILLFFRKNASTWEKVSGMDLQRTRTAFGVTDEQKFRHEVMKFYICQWFKGDFPDWSSFVRKVGKTTKHMGVEKPWHLSALFGIQLTDPLETIKSHFSSLPEIRNILLYLHKGESSNPISRVSKDFDLVKIDYSQDSVDNFIRIVI